ncbi:Cu(I)-responsive transcriptional regulator [Pseudomarimonas salicorniae]|uniref:Cu(I)-responsive transcriptional regulator n=1 Tax=Pseudomarimonas salicorniae TaxID=2933270 RepID=A0ABT0GKB0_9GAMM|nr:Cu(I)-responsive transcriptional regulator [Lysobacter sp. CAU 1642]MCK7594986.1 Cu(I)-responsive transcriptional regulator [Lysobacter sp. CAU 1642]
MSTQTGTQRGLRRWTIGDAARRSAVSAKMIRHYESIGLMPAADRSLSNYRLYRDEDIHRLRFIHRARKLGFAIPRIATLLALWDDPARPSAEVKALAAGHVAELQARIAELQSMVRTLEHLGRHCHGDARPDCPILDELGGERDV